jgi:hypothetical protein
LHPQEDFPPQLPSPSTQFNRGLEHGGAGLPDGYGTDYPDFGFDQFAELRKLGLSPGDLDAIGHGNAAQLIARLRAWSGRSHNVTLVTEPASPWHNCNRRRGC